MTSTVQWQQGTTLEVDITDLSSGGEGVGRWDNRVVFVPDTVPGDRVQTRLVQVKRTFARGKLLQVIRPAADRVRPACIVADKCGGCQWQPVAYGAQLAAKERQVQEALQRIGGFDQVAIAPILAAEAALHYRNKATYPLELSPQGKVKAGYYRKGTHRLVNLNQCPVQDERLDPLLAGIKVDIQGQGWSIYDETTHTGALRHLSLRIGRRTGEALLTLVSTTWDLPDLETLAAHWQARYPQLVGVCVNLNAAKTNAILGPETRYVVGRPYLTETFAGLTFRIYPDTFFQVYTEQAERLLQCILEHLPLQGTETVVDAYCGIGTLTLPLAQRVAYCLGLEVQEEAVAVAQENAALNGLLNVSFRAGTVATLLPQAKALLSAATDHSEPRSPDIVLLDPPRKGCEAAVIEALLVLRPPHIVYMSCNPATLARDLQQLCGEGRYRLTHLQPADFFPQTAHVECVAFLVA